MFFLFNDALNTFYLRLYGVRHMVKDHSDSEKGNPLPPHRLLFPINSKGSFICTIPHSDSERKEMFYLTTHSTHFIYGYMASDMVKDHSDSERERKEMFYLTTHSTHFIYGYMASDMW